MSTFKIINVPIEAHAIAKQIAYDTRLPMARVVLMALREYALNHASQAATAPITLSGMASSSASFNTPTRPSPAYVEPVLLWETILAVYDKDIPAVIPDGFPRERALMDTIVLKIDAALPDGYSFAKEGDMATMVLSEFAGVDNEVHRISPEQRAALETIRALPAVVQVRQDGESFIPVNDTAKAVLALGAGKRTFNKYNLFALHHVGFRIEYVE